VVVMLDGDLVCRTFTEPGLEIHWGAYLGSPDEVLVAGPLREVIAEIELAFRCFDPGAQVLAITGTTPRRQPTGWQPPAAGPFRILRAAASTADLSGGVLADLGDHVVREAHQVEPVGHHDRVRQGVGDRAQVGRGQVDRHVRDGLAPRIGLLLNPFDDLGGGASVDVRQQAAGSGGVDDPGVPPVVRDAPPAAVLVLFPLRLPAAGLIDPQHGHRRQWLRELAGDVRNVRLVRDRPRDHVVLGAGEHARELLGDPRAASAP